MLENLFGGKNLFKTLLFLLINGKCYGTQLQRVLGLPLTPLQKALQKLEKEGIITSYFEGKTRLYHFNPAYPLLAELEQLLKKCYTLLPAQEKKGYYFASEAAFPEAKVAGGSLKVLLTFWEKLLAISELSFIAKSKSPEGAGWNGKGRGAVTITREETNSLIFNEKGSWQGDQGEVSFSNIFRWTLDRSAGIVSLEHLRYGMEHPVFLFHLAPSGASQLASVDSHLCKSDSYFGRIHFDKKLIRLHWRIIGPRKNEEIDYFYS